MTKNNIPPLHIKYSGRIIDQLGIQMYQSPVAAIAELIANGWDAEAKTVDVTLPEDISDKAEFIINDNGNGMTLTDCEERYLNVGYCRRGDSPKEFSPKLNRPILGRKGIGKFAGFGIAEMICVETISKSTGERTVFELDLNNLRGQDYVTRNHEIPVVEYDPPDDTRKKSHGTVIYLKKLKLSRASSQSQFLRSMGRRFLLHRTAQDFNILINGQELIGNEEIQDIQFIFPRDYREKEKPDDMAIEEDWGVSKLSDGKLIRWQICFYKKPIAEESLRGVSVFLHGKLAQTPFFFNLTGGLGGQHGQEYISGQVQADYLDELDTDIIAPERQRINWELTESQVIESWGRETIRSLLRIWKDRRAERKIQVLNERVAPFSERLNKLPPHERKIIKKAITNLAKVSALEEDEFVELGRSLLTAWEGGRLQELIAHLSEVESLDEGEFLNILIEEEIISSLNIAEAVKTKIMTVGKLKDLVQKKALENTIRDYISEHPWLIAPELQTFAKEKSLKTLLDKLAKQYNVPVGKEGKRVDLVLSSMGCLVVIEFMRPGEKLDIDHLGRYELYFRAIKTNVIKANTGSSFERFTGYIVADELEKDAVMLDKIQSLKTENMLAMDWNILIQKALRGWQEFLETLASREPTDERLKALLE